MADEKKTCYIIGPIGRVGSPERAWANFLCTYIIEPAVTAHGYAKPERSEQDFSQELIMVGIINQVAKADLVIADLTWHNPCVYFELGMRHLFEKPMIHVMRDDQRFVFDLSMNRTIPVSIEPGRVTQAIKDIRERIDYINADPQQIYSFSQASRVFEEVKEGQQPGELKDAALAIIGVMVKQFAQLSKEVSTLSNLIIRKQAPPSSSLDFLTHLWDKEHRFAEPA